MAAVKAAPNNRVKIPHRVYCSYTLLCSSRLIDTTYYHREPTAHKSMPTKPPVGLPIGLPMGLSTGLLCTQ